MSIEAIYEDGVFKPLDPVDLPERCRVEVSFAPLPDAALDRAVARDWSLHLVRRVAPDFEELPPGFEESSR